MNLSQTLVKVLQWGSSQTRAQIVDSVEPNHLSSARAFQSRSHSQPLDLDRTALVSWAVRTIAVGRWISIQRSRQSDRASCVLG